MTLGIAVKGITKSFGRVRALKDVSAELPERGIVGLVGPNGAGKTTLIDIITGFTLPDKGRVFFNGRDITGIKPFRLTRLGLARTFQDLRLIYDESVLSNLLLWSPEIPSNYLARSVFGWRDSKIAHEIEADKAQSLLRLTGLADRPHIKAGELSYGQQKLLTLACCLAAEVKTIFLDEPTAGLQSEIKNKVQELLRSLSEQGVSLFFIEHDLEFTKNVADEVWVMSEGEIISRGKPHDVLGSKEVLGAYVD